MENGTLEAQIRSFTVAKAWWSLRKSCGVLWNPVEIRGLPREARPQWGLQSRQRPEAVRFCRSYEWSAAGGGGQADFPQDPAPFPGAAKRRLRRAYQKRASTATSGGSGEFMRPTYIGPLSLEIL